MAEQIKICKRCVMDSTDPNIVFDENGFCNYCTDVEIRKPSEYFPNDEGKRILEAKFAEIKEAGKGKKYDCMVGVSGGLDSSYVLYLGYKYSLRMLAVHIDDGLDTEIAKKNIKNLCEKAHVELVNVVPNMEQYKDVLLSFFKAGVPNLAMAQDSALVAALNDTADKYGVLYNLSGGNFSMESILQKGITDINYCDKKHIKAIHKKFGKLPDDKLRFVSFFEKYIKRRYASKCQNFLPLNYVDYRLDKVLAELKEFSDYNYYGGKHYESILTRFLQCWYLPNKYNYDKRKSHFSSLIMTDQLTRDDAIERLKSDPYMSEELKQSDFHFISEYFGISYDEFIRLINAPAKLHSDYPESRVNSFAGIARKFRKYLG